MAVAVVLLGLLVIAVVARSSPSHPLHAHPAPPHNASVSPRPLQTQTSADQSPPPGHPVRPSHKAGPNWLARVALAALAIALVWVAWWLSGHRRSRRVTRNAARGRPGAVADRGSGVAPDDVSAAVDQSIEAIERGPVTDAIIACWVLVEHAAASAGVDIRPSETSSEFVDRVLGSYGAREAALRQLAALYREARFSTHTMGELSRDEARACLADIRADLAGTRAAP